MIDNTNKRKSSDCKENILEMIEGALTANRTENYCTCTFYGEEIGACNYCKIDQGLRAAKACIIASVGRLDMMRANMLIMQVEIEEKLRRIMEE